ncbi:MAG: hypothetical protein H6970_13265 [Gammaproteobacteria bacterium]|nr:hypothetical protein [Gammaproteobacteria bacterium]MCP5458667.1 hypothetical protein [Gammaproteobacteria bacterium]
MNTPHNNPIEIVVNAPRWLVGNRDRHAIEYDYYLQSYSGMINIPIAMLNAIFFQSFSRAFPELVFLTTSRSAKALIQVTRTTMAHTGLAHFRSWRLCAGNPPQRPVSMNRPPPIQPGITWGNADDDR